GVELAPQQRARFKAIMQELARLTSKFSENVLDATQGWGLTVTDEGRLGGLPDSARALARQSAEQQGEQGWRFTLEFPSYFPVLTHAEDRALRRELYTAYVTRASDEGPNAGQWDNGPLMEQILALRHEEAQLLGFGNFAELSLATKMAADTDQVVQFLEQLAGRSLPAARAELDEVRA